MSCPLPILKGSSRYSLEDQSKYREAFAPLAQQYRSFYRRVLLVLPVGAAISFVAWNIIPASFVEWAIAPVFISAAIVMLLKITISPSLECPACHRNLDVRKLGDFCPECGAANLKPGDLLSSPQCDACGKKLRRRKGRLFKIRACTHCGLFLDDEGV